MIRIWLMFFAIMIAFFVFSSTKTYDQTIGLPINVFYAKLCSVILNLFGYQTTSNQDNVSGSLFTMSVSKGCDAVAPFLMLISAIGLYPYATLRNKLKGIGIGFGLLFTINLIRLCSLYIIGAHVPEWFEFFHIQFWQAFFILISMAYLILWLKLYSN